ncbi:acyl-CoA dehydrogenase [Streptomyces sp. NPDC005279]|uniref:acyl-CoA dehydrogenase family protein n=1 Tax=Streptomyces sp. NPDC005279 TaxID=3364712 RepID=UPI00369057D8
MTLLTFQTEAPTNIGAKKKRSGAIQPEDLSRLSQTPVTTGELTDLLFDRDDRARVHETWRKLISTEEFSYRPGLLPAERTSLSYDRLRLLNGVVDCAEELACDPRRLASLHEWTGVVDGALGTLAGIHYNLFIGSLVDHNSGKRRDLSDFTSLRRTGTFLCTELGHGNDAAALQTTAELDSRTGEFVLHTPNPEAQKFMPNTSVIGGPKSAVVAARLLIGGEDRGVFLFLTPLSDQNGYLPGIRIRTLPERTGSPVDHCLTSFDHVRLPREALLEDEHGRLDADGEFSSSVGNPRKRFLHSIGRVTSGKLCMSAAGIGVTRAALSIAVRYAHHRHISGPRTGERVLLTDHRSHHGRLLHSLSTGYAMTFLHRAVVDRWTGHTPEDQAEAERLVAIAKGWITWEARSITIECRERCGAQGLFHANGIAEFPLNLEGAITAEGDNLAVWVKAAAEMVFGHRTDRRSSFDVPLDERSLTDLPFLRSLLADIEGIWQTRARAALRVGPVGDPLGRWNAASAAALEMVSAHARLQAADAFIDAADRAQDPAARSLLENLCRLFLLRQLTEHTGDLLAEDHLAVHHIRGLHETTDAIIAELAPHMMTLVEAFDLPAEFLTGIPIANGAYVDRVVDDLAVAENPLAA